ncbi:MAG TPA: hypothetical protein IGS52_04220 [Oscillatoriaceae cyanobacterium M33_DOE_052]|uniref:Terpene synthase n=1 Tax=Planktothricoides sp. SpSt-374 TaxID=2282167 RepID=A0A7C3VML9_9CYAN|nr:hypothetical protein [Oscillatoriaceae cyanobacterium M33_DOE_052]
MLNIKFPALYCPFDSGINPDADAAGQHSLEWARFWNLVTDESALQRLQAIKFSSLVARTYPNAPLPALEIISDYFLWLFIFDDQFEKAGINGKIERLEAEHARLVEILNGAELKEVDTLAALTLGDIRDRLHQLGAMPDLMVRFAQNMENYLQGVRWEAVNLYQGVMPDLATYRKIRAFTSGIYAYCDLLQIVDRIALPPEIIEDGRVKRLELTTNNVMAWSNDIFSVKKEIAEGKTHNLVLVLQHEYHIPLQEALDRAAEMHDVQVRTFIELSAQLPSFGAEIDAHLQRYLSGLRSWMRGHLDWYMETGRYHSKESTPLS